MKLSKAQYRAYSKLTYEWKSAYELGESIRTLNSLVKVCNIKIQYNRGYSAYPKTEIKYKKD